MTDISAGWNVEELFNDLRRISPMPSDRVVTQDTLDEYKRIIDGIYDILEAPSGCDKLPKDASDILLDSVGDGEGFGLYESTVTILVGLVVKASHADGVAHCALKQRALSQTSSESSRRVALYALAELAFPSDIDVFTFTIENTSNKEILTVAFSGLYRIGDIKAYSVVKAYLASDRDDVRSLAFRTNADLKLKHAK